MFQTRRDFLKLLAGAVLTTASDTVFGKSAPDSPITPAIKNPSSKEADILWWAYFPTLKENEGEKLHFYRCSRNKLTIGYGSNIEDNPKLLNEIPIFHKGKPLTSLERKDFFKSYKTKKASELASYSITRPDAEKMARSFVNKAISELANIFKDYKTHKSIFFDLPIPMQALALDVYYNVGSENFAKYKRFKKSIFDHNFVRAAKEAIVYTGNKTVNKARERRKKRFLKITQIIQENATRTLKQIQELVLQDYKKETPKLIQILSGRADKICENSLISAEYIRKEEKRLYATSQKPFKEYI